MSDRIKIILQEIASGSRKDVEGIIFSVSELLTKDDVGVTFLEYLFKKKIELDSVNNVVIKNNKDIAYLYCTYKKDLDFFELSEEDLFSMINGRTYVEYFIVKGKLTSGMLNVINNREEIVDLILNNKRSRYLEQLNLDIINKLMVKNSDGNYEIEKYVKYKKGFSIMMSLINEPRILLELARKYNNFSWLKCANEKALMANLGNNKSFLMYLMDDLKIKPNILNTPFSGEFAVFLYNNGLYDYLFFHKEYFSLEIESGKIMLEGLIENGYIPQKLFFVDNEQIFKVLYEKKYLDLIIHVSNEILMKTAKEVLLVDDCDDNESLLGYLIDKGYDPFRYLYNIYDQDVVRILYKKRRIDLLEQIPFETLLSIDDGSEYFRCILQSFKDNVLKSNKLVNKEAVDRVLEYVFVPDKYDISDYLLSVDKDILLLRYGNGTFLDKLLDVDREFVVNEFRSSSLLTNRQIVSILESRGITPESVTISNDLPLSFEKNLANRYGIGPLPQEGELLLKELEQLFLTDGKSDKNLISVLVRGYRHSLFIDYDVYIKEIKNLISVKKKNYDKFYYIKTEVGSFFTDDSIYCDDFSVDTLMHETGHALHYYLVDDLVLENYGRIASNVRRSSKILMSVENFVKDYHDLRKLIELILKQRYIDFFGSCYYDEDKRKEINDFLKQECLLRKEKLRKLGLTDKFLESKLNNDFTFEKFMTYQRKLFIDKKIHIIMRNEFECIYSVSDILDALFIGKLHYGVLKNGSGDEMKAIAGHGISYYKSDSKKAFYEIIANFSVLLKSKDAEFGLQLLKSIVGDKFYNIILKFYYQYIINVMDDNIEASKGR